MAQIRPSTVTNTVVQVPLSNISRPTLARPAFMAAPTDWEIAETSRDRPIRKIQSPEVALRALSFSTSALAAAAMASRPEVLALVALFHLLA